MAEFKPTVSQAAAIESRGSAVLVSAGAGSGKTKVLTERLMHYICDSSLSVDLDSFLIITFTRAAAGELRGRIMEELAAALARDPGNKRLRRQSALCQRAQIGTIHSFCASLLRQYSHLCGLSPDFKIIDDDRANAMKASALDRVLEERYSKSERYPGFILLADTVGSGRDDSKLSQLVLDLHSRMQCHARPDLWAKEQVELLSRQQHDIAQTPWGQEIMDWAAGISQYWSDEFDRIVQDMAEYPQISAAYLPSISETADALREFRRCLRLGWDRSRACLPISFPKLKALRNSPAPELSERIKKQREACKKEMGSLAGAFYSDSLNLLEEIRQTGPAMAALLSLTLDFDKAFASDKRRLALADYADLEHLTARLLTNEDGSPSELALGLSQRYTEIMVDEYQDVSRVQDTIFRAISREGKNLFMVGDVKQSIYRFRLADPGIFTEKYLSYADADSAVGHEPRRILLRENFRSRREILDCANTVFSLCMSRELGDIDYDEKAALVCGAPYEGSVPLPELMLLALPDSEDGEERPDKTALEAEMVAAKIRELKDSGLLINQRGEPRPLEYGDIAILLRSPNSVAGVYHRALAQQGIPSAATQSGAYFSSVEISTVMSMLAVVDNPHQDIPLIAVLRSPAFGFTADELSRIRAVDKSADFYTALCLAAEDDEKCSRFLSCLCALREAAPDMATSELLWQLISDLDLLAICSAMNDGAQRRANLMELVELSENYEKSGYKGLHRFVLWLRRLAQRGQEPSAAPSGPAVQIMSVHKSKGLEFPVVFLCDTARQFNKQDSRDTVLVHPKLGLGPKLTDLQRRVQYPTLARNAIKLRQEREMLSEEMRLLYVALTRPKERLFISAALKDPEATIEKARMGLSSPMAPQRLATAPAPIHWLISAALADEGRTMQLGIHQCARHTDAVAEESRESSVDPQLLSELEHKLSFVYPHKEAELLPSKVTATELKAHSPADEDAFSIAPSGPGHLRMPDFARADKPLSGTEKGIATHLVLQYIDFSKTDSIAEIENEISRLEAARFISSREAKAVDAKSIFKLFSSPVGAKLRGPGTLHREFKFSLLWDAEAIFSQGQGEEVLLQGVVDCCIEDDEGLCIVDYKTDNVRSEEEISKRAALYSSQLAAYAAALERIFKKPIKECALYFIRPGVSVILPQK